MNRSRVLSPREVAELFGVDVKTITRWADSGKLPVGHRTMGNHRRWYEDEIQEVIESRA